MMVATPVRGAPVRTLAGDLRALWSSAPDRHAVLATWFLFAVVVLMGATTSSIGFDNLREDPDAVHTDHWGQPQSIRSDEYNVGTPIRLSIMATGDQPTLSPLGAEASLPHRYAGPGSVFQPIVFFDATVLRAASVLPDAQVFAFQYWLPYLLVLLLLPVWFTQLGASRVVGWACALLVVLSPSVAWWSGQPVGVLAYPLAGCVAMLAAHRRFAEGQRWRPGALVALGGVLIAGMPAAYIPWVVMLALPVLVASTATILASRTTWSSRLLAVGLTGVIALVLGVGALLEASEGVQAILGTVYPGERRVSAESQPFGFLFGAPLLAAMMDTPPVETNQSELSTAYTVSFVVLGVVLVGLLRHRVRRAGAAEWVVGVSAVIWLVWCTVDLGGWTARLPVFNQVTPSRAAQVVGIAGLLALGLALSRQRAPAARWRAALLPAGAAAAAAVVTGLAAAELNRGELPQLSGAGAVAVVLGVGLAAYALVRWPRRWVTVALVGLLAASVVWRANPLQFGLGDLRGTTAADTMRAAGERARDEGYLWATDAGAFDVLMLATGVPSLSGFQRSGPDVAQWTRIDPEREFEEAWNRGGGYVRFWWGVGQPTQVTTNGFDLVEVTVDPCVLGESFTELRYIAAQAPLSASCLVPDRMLTWSGTELHVYELTTYREP